MRFIFGQSVLALLLLFTTVAALAGEIMVEDFEIQPQTRWRFFTDSVMGGVSAGQVAFVPDFGIVIQGGGDLGFRIGVDHAGQEKQRNQNDNFLHRNFSSSAVLNAAILTYAPRN